MEREHIARTRRAKIRLRPSWRASPYLRQRRRSSRRILLRRTRTKASHGEHHSLRGDEMLVTLLKQAKANTRKCRTQSRRYIETLVARPRREVPVEKIITCTKCRKTFTVSGPYSSAKQVPQGVTCPFCGEANDVLWPMDTAVTTIPKNQSA